MAVSKGMPLQMKTNNAGKITIAKTRVNYIAKQKYNV